MSRSITESEARAQIDRLVINELAEPQRTALLEWLDEDASRWRRCALAFLEAQMWEQAAAPTLRATRSFIPFDFAEPAPDIAIARPDKTIVELAANHVRDDGEGTSLLSPGRRKVAAPLRNVLIAALVLIAFVGGIGLERAGVLRFTGRAQETAAPAASPTDAPSSDPTSHETMIATVSVRTNLDPKCPLQLQVPIAAVASESPKTGLSEAERRLWEQRGFEVHEETRYLPAKLPDGREVAVPVNKVRLKFRGAPVS